MAGSNKVTKLELRLVDGLSGPAKAAVKSVGALNRALGSVKGAAFGGGSRGGVIDAATGGRGGFGSSRGTRAGLDVLGRQVGDFKRHTGEVVAAAAGAGAGLFAMGRSAYASEVELNKAMAAGNLSMEQRRKAEANAVDLNRKYTISVNDILAAHVELLRSGLSFEDSLKALPNTLNLAQATGEQTTDTTKAIVTNLTALRKAMGDSTRAADLFVAALDATSGVNLGDLATSGKYFNPVAALTGQSPEQAMAYQIEFAKRGLFGSSAGTGLRAGPAAILSPSKNARAAFAAIGLDPSKYIGERTGKASAETISATLESRGMPVSDETEAALAGIIKSQRTDTARAKAIIAAFGEEMGLVTAQDRAEAMDALMQAFNVGASKVDIPKLLTDARKRGAGIPFFNDVFGKNHGSKWAGFDPSVYDQQLKMLETVATGSADRKSAIMIQGLVGDVNDLEGSYQAFVNTLKNSGAMTDAARAMHALAEGVDRLAAVNPQLLRIGVAATAAAVAMVPLGFAITGVTAAAALLVNPVALAGAALVGLAAINMKPIGNGLRSLSDGFRRTIDPKILAGLGGMKVQLGELVAALKRPDHALDGAAGQIGRLAAGLVNDATKLGPVLTDYGERIRSFGAAAVAANLPAITAGLDSFRAALAGFVSTRIDALVGLGSSLGAFMETMLPKFTPAAASAVSLFAASFRTLGAGLDAVGQVVGAATTGLATFARTFIDNIDPAAMQSVANGVKAALDAITVPVRALGDAYASIGRSIAGASGDIDAFAATAGARLAAGFNAITSVLSTVGSYVPNFSGITGAVSSFVGTIVGLVDRLAGAIQRMRDAVANMPSVSGMFGGLSTVPAAPKGGLIGNALSGAALPRKASGGLVRGGRSYLVGERGPEIFNPGRTGNVTPNHRLGSGGGDTHHWHIQSTDPMGVVGEIERRWATKIRRSNQIGLDGGRRG